MFKFVQKAAILFYVFKLLKFEISSNEKILLILHLFAIISFYLVFFFVKLNKD